MASQHEELLSKIKGYGNPTIDEILSILEAKNRVPKLSVDPVRYNGGSYRPSTNELKLGEVGQGPNVVSHELNHALENLMESDYYQFSRLYSTLSSKQRQFYDAYKKLNPETSKVPYTAGKELLPSEVDYRFKDPDEKRSWGVGNMASSDRGLDWPGGGHLDATMASEAAVLRNLYKKQMSDPKTTWIDKLIQMFK